MTEKKHCCSFCQTPGHTTKTCVLRLNQLKNIEAVNSKSRNEFLELLDKTGFYINSLIELKYKDFSSPVRSREDAETGLFYIKQIRWESVNKSFIIDQCLKPLRNYFSLKGAITTNYANVIVCSPDYPNGFSMTVTIDKLLQALKHDNFNIQTALIGEFVVHDAGDKEETLKKIPPGFTDGKFYTSSKKIIK
jgi:hypothetical protein